MPVISSFKLLDFAIGINGVLLSFKEQIRVLFNSCLEFGLPFKNSLIVSLIRV